MKLVINTGSYNHRRYGRPWAAKVTFTAASLSHFDFVPWVGRDGDEGLLQIEAFPGEIVALGQKDTRKPANSAPQYYIVTAHAHDPASDSYSDMHEAGFTPVSKKDAYLHYVAHRTDVDALQTERERLVLRLGEINTALVGVDIAIKEKDKSQ